MAMLAFSESAAMTTARHRETALNASEATTASINRGEATLALWPLKPCAPAECIMLKNPLRLRANHPRDWGDHPFPRRQHWGTFAMDRPQALTVVNDWVELQQRRGHCRSS